MVAAEDEWELAAPDRVADETIGLPAGGSIPDRHQLHRMLLDQPDDLRGGAVLLVQVDHAGLVHRAQGRQRVAVLDDVGQRHDPLDSLCPGFSL